MNKKTLIAPVLATMLAVSCGGSSPVKDWSKEIKDFMTAELGEVLPYMELDEASLKFGFESDSWGGTFYAYDDNDKDLTAAYGEKLVAAGFTAEEGGYSKVTEVSEVSVSLTYYEAQGTEGEEGYIAPGNEIDIGYLYKTEPAGSWDETFATFMDSKVKTSFPYLPIDVDETNFHFDESTKMQYYAFGTVEQDETVSYGFRLAKAGFSYEPDEKVWFKALDDRAVTISYIYIDPEEAASYGYDSGLIEIHFANREIYLDYYPSEEAEVFFLEEPEEEIEVPEFIYAGENVEFCYDEGKDMWGEYFADIYGYGTTSAELKEYVKDLVDAGWLVSDYDDEDTYLFYPDTTVRCDVYEITEVDPTDPYTCWVSFYTSENGPFAPDNTSTAYTVAYKLGLNAEEDVIDTSAEGAEYKSYAVMYSFAGMSLAETEAYVKGVVSTIPGYYYSADMSKTVPSKEDPQVIEGYIDVFVVDGYETGDQYIAVQLYADDENVGQIAMYMEISGKPREKVYDPKGVLEYLLANTAIGSAFPFTADDITDYSAEAGFPYFSLGGYSWPAEKAQLIAYYFYSSIEGSLKSFKLQQTDGNFATKQVELTSGETVTLYYLDYVWTSKDGTQNVILTFSFYITSAGRVVPELEAYSIPANPSTDA